MKRVFLLLPTVLLIAAACTAPLPPKRATWRRPRAHINSGARVTILPVDIRSRIKGSFTDKLSAELYTSVFDMGMGLWDLIPDLLAGRNYSVNRAATWSGTVVSPDGTRRPVLTQRQMTRVMSALAYFASLPNNRSTMMHYVAPGALKPLAPESELSFYIATWHTLSTEKTGGQQFLEFLAVAVTVLIIVAVVALVVAAIASGGKGGGGLGGLGSLAEGGKALGEGLGHLLEAGIRLAAAADSVRFSNSYKGSRPGLGLGRDRAYYTPSFVSGRARTAAMEKQIQRSFRRSREERAKLLEAFMKSVQKSILPVNQPQVQAAPVPGHPESTRIDLEESKLARCIKNNLPAAQRIHSNYFMGVVDGLSTTPPPYRHAGQYFAFVLMDNKSGAVLWDAQIYIPQGTKKFQFIKVMKHLFLTFPRVITKKPKPRVTPKTQSKPATTPVQPYKKPPPVVPPKEGSDTEKMGKEISL